MKPGIPTTGPRGIKFRSRLEAKYAFLFEYLHWSWDYEAIDLQGYIPDFIVYFAKKRRLMIEIKGDVDTEFRTAAEKLFRSGYILDAVMLGSRSPEWVEHKRLLQVEGRYIKPAHVDHFKAEGWSLDDGKEVFYDKRNKRLWRIYEDIRLSYCHLCFGTVFSFANTCILCQTENLAKDVCYGNISEVWWQICNQTQWQPRGTTLRMTPLQVDKPAGKPRVVERKEFLTELWKNSGRSSFCEWQIWDWQAMTEDLNKLEAVFVSGKGCPCCEGNFVLIESCNMSILDHSKAE